MKHSSPTKPKHAKHQSNEDIRLHVSSPPLDSYQITSGPQDELGEGDENAKMSLGQLLKQLREQKTKDRSKIMGITSEYKFFEIFNKRGTKC